MNAPIACVGLGNLLLGDEGLGVHLMRALRSTLSHPAITWIDGGTIGLSLLPYIEDSTWILFLDAVRSGAPPGTVTTIPLWSERPRIPLKFSAHDIALPDLVTLLRLRRSSIRDVRLVGIVPHRITVTLDLSETVTRAFPRAIRQAQRILQSWLDQIPTTEASSCVSVSPDASSK